MTITSKKLATTTAATFAAAFSSLYAAPELQADVVDISFDSFDRWSFLGLCNFASGSLAMIGAGPIYSFPPVQELRQAAGFSADVHYGVNLARVGSGAHSRLVIFRELIVS